MAGHDKARSDLLAQLALEGDPILGTSDGATWHPGGDVRQVRSPIDQAPLGRIAHTTPAQYDAVVAALQAAFQAWRHVPAPRRAEVVRLWGDQLRRRKSVLGRLVSLEMGKSIQEGLGEVQEMIDICDFAVGLGRQLYGKTMHSERPQHRMYEQWHPLGICAVITAFNFPVAVYAWNAAIALVCGDTVLWKPSEKTPLTAVAAHTMLMEAASQAGHPGVCGLVTGDAALGKAIAADGRIVLVSATGSCGMGRSVGQTVAARMGRSILELGGNNGIVVAPSADLDLAQRAIVFGSIGTAGQRCTSTRRVFLHDAVADEMVGRLQDSWAQVRVGDPLDEAVHMGPLIDEGAVQAFRGAVAQATQQGGHVLAGGGTMPELGPCYVQPTLVDCRHIPFPDFPLAQEETFAPVLYLFGYRHLDEAIAWHNGVRQGLSSALFTNDMREAERWLSHGGSDCGIANVNIGTSGAEIGGAFGGEKETGGGREAGSDAWKQYMRRQTCTINWGTDLPLAQGIRWGGGPQR